jgi:bile acid:Na+ symporter, BASS family
MLQDSALIDIGLPLVLAFVMVGIGLTLQVEDFTRQREAPVPSVVGIVGQVVGVPLLAFMVATVMGLPPALAIGLVLVAATSGGTTSNVMAYLARGNVALGLVLTVVTNLISILTLPFWVGRALQLWGGELGTGSYVSVGFGDVAGLLIVIIFIPVAIGMFVRAKWPGVASKLERSVSLVSFVALFGLIIGIVISLGSEALTMLAQVGPAALILAVLAVGLGLGLGLLFRMDRRDHLAMAMEFSIKNVTLSMLIALSTLSSDEMALPSAVYGVVMYIPGLALLYLSRKYLGQQPAPDVEPARRPVVVGYDGADGTFPALRWAAAEAAATEHPLRVVLAWGMPTRGVSAVSQTADLDSRHAQGVLDEAVARLRAEVPGLEVEGDLVRGKPAQALLDDAADASIVVVGNQSRSTFGRLVLGSVSSAVVTYADVPVVLVRSDAGSAGEVWRQGPVVVGVDGSAGSEAAVHYAFEASLKRGMAVTLVHTSEGPPPTVPGATARGTTATAVTGSETGLLELSPALAEARREYPAVDVTEVVETGHPADAIVAAGADASLTVVGSRGHGGFRGLLLGSVSRAVMEHAKSPVAVVRPHE